MCFVLTHGFVKKRDRWLRSDLETALGIMKDDLQRKLTLQRKG